MNINKQGCVGASLASLLVLSACGGGSSGVVVEDAQGSDGDVTVPAAATPATPTSGSTVVDPSVELETGRFVDSAVSGLEYDTPTQSGITGADGSFKYIAGETVIFSIGDVALPVVSGSELVTPLTVFNTNDIADTRVINLTRLLQSLDVDANPSNGISISDEAIASGTGLSLDFTSANFDTEAANLVANSGSSQTSLIDGETALDHFQETLFVEGVFERPEAPTAAEPETTEPPVTSEPAAIASHPLVGTVHELTTRAHRVTGTVTIVDDRTIEVSNFNYDGGGPSVFFYTGNNGNYSSGSGAGIIGSQLNGRTYDNETIVLTIPDNLTLDDFDGLSVWCDIFFASFGDVEF